MRLTAVYSPAAGEVIEWCFDVPAGTTAREALHASGLLQARPELQGQSLDVGVWGRACLPTQPMQEGDRLEVYRPLQVDPKVARRERFKGQGVRTAGLFKQRRPGAKAGY